MLLKKKETYGKSHIYYASIIRSLTGIRLKIEFLLLKQQAHNTRTIEKTGCKKIKIF